MKKEIVVAAYNRDLKWLSNINNDVKKTIYRKGNNELNHNEIFIDNNVGRDVHTFFYHIVKNYENLADVTYFAQDFPFDHWGNLIEIVNGDYSDLQKCELNIDDGYFGFHNNKLNTAWIMPKSKQFSNGSCLECLSNGLPHDNSNGVNVDYYWNILFKENPPSTYEFIPGGHFAITKNQLLIRSKEFYSKVCELLETNIHSPWNFERLECYIFNKNYISLC